MTNEYRIFGPPGTGKTTAIVTEINALLREGHYLPHELMIVSFSKAAANELLARDLYLPAECVGTLHAICYRLLGGGRIAEENLKDFKGNYSFTSTQDTTDDPFLDDSTQESGEDGAKLLAQLTILRAKMIAPSLYPPEVSAFARSWNAWKDEFGYRDYTDLIELALNFMLPDTVKILFVDEAQDFTPLQFKVVRNWAQSLDRLYIIGDDDQTIFNFTGASPDSMLTPHIPEGPQNRVLTQSYRLAPSVHRLAVSWIDQISHRRSKTYLPTKSRGDGSIEPTDATYRHPDVLIDDAEREADAGRSVMILASASHHLGRSIKVLRERGIPFENSYRPSRGDWNPLVRRENTKSTASRLYNHLLPTIIPDKEANITWEELFSWVDIINSDVFGFKGAKKYIQDKAKSFPYNIVSLDEYMILFKKEYVSHALTGNLEWFQRVILPSKANSMVFPTAVYRRRYCGDDLISRPRITIGTIHSVKGGEADTVYLFPDLSMAAYEEFANEGHDNIIRVYYVAITRARTRLVIARPVSKMCVSLI